MDQNLCDCWLGESCWEYSLHTWIVHSPIWPPRGTASTRNRNLPSLPHMKQVFSVIHNQVFLLDSQHNDQLWLATCNQLTANRIRSPPVPVLCRLHHSPLLKQLLLSIFCQDLNSICCSFWFISCACISHSHYKPLFLMLLKRQSVLRHGRRFLLSSHLASLLVTYGGVLVLRITFSWGLKQHWWVLSTRYCC